MGLSNDDIRHFQALDAYDVKFSQKYGAFGLQNFDTMSVEDVSLKASDETLPPKKHLARTFTQRFRDARSEMHRKQYLPPLRGYIWRTVLHRMNPRNHDLSIKKEDLQSFAMMVPLVAAVLAPICTLYDIPALSQNWYTFQGSNVPDVAPSLVLSAVGLAFNLAGNTLLILRFCRFKYWHLSAHLSLAFWMIKTILDLVNVSVYGAGSRNRPGYLYDEGFWCAVTSVILSGVISVILLFHGIMSLLVPFQSANEEDWEEIRDTGRTFMLSVTVMVCLLALEALIFSKIEDWSFLQGIYFAVVTGFTIGYGDFTPTVTSTKVLLFFFAIASITYLANQVSMIIDFINQRAAKRKLRWRAHFEEIQQDRVDEAQPELNLASEVVFLDALAERETVVSQLYDLFLSGIALAVLLFVSAIAFSRIEGWSYGDSLYYCYVTLLTIGYGDFSPDTPGGRVFFIIFALLSVPIVTSFAVQTVTGLLAAVAHHRIVRRQEKLENEIHKDAFTPHGDLVSQHSAFVDGRLRAVAQRKGNDDVESIWADTDLKRECKDRMSIALLDLAIRLEMQARILLIGNLDSTSRAHTLLRADLHVQSKIRQALWKDHLEHVMAENPMEPEDPYASHHRLYQSHPEADALAAVAKPPDVLTQIRDYRKTFAQLLAVGSKLLHLEGYERYHFERRMMEDSERASDELTLANSNG